MDKEFNNVTVRFFSPPEAHHARYVLAYAGDIFWQGCPGGEHSYVDLNSRTESATVDELIQTQTYEFDDLRWSSHVGGVRAWTTRSYNP